LKELEMRAMQKSILAAAVGAAALAMTTFTPVQAGVVGPMSTTAQTEMSADIVHKVRRRGRGLAIGAGILTLGIIGALAARDRAHARPYRYESRRRNNYNKRCRRLLRWCRRGDDRACWRYDNRC
jgi:hypothetical protein